MAGGYDEGYSACTCFWGRSPGSLLSVLDQLQNDYANLTVLDLGCGDGRNAAYLANRGATVLAIDISELAVRNARLNWPAVRVDFRTEDATQLDLQPNSYDIVLMYGLPHCLPKWEAVSRLVEMAKEATKPGGYNLVAAYNSRRQDLSAHPGFEPLLRPHGDYVGLYRDWGLPHASDTDLFERHPHNGIPHVHSMTRILSRKAEDFRSREFSTLSTPTLF